MKLHFKFLLSLLLGLGLVYGASVIYQQIRQNRLVHTLSTVNLQAEEENQWQAIENLQKACDSSLTDSMVEGEMERFRRILAGQKQVRGLQELTVFNVQGLATDSTEPKVLKTRLAEELLLRIQKDSSPWRERTPEAFIFYQPMPVTQGCLECHANFKKYASGGLYRYRFSAQALTEAQARWTGFRDEISRAGRFNALITSVTLLVMATLLVIWLVRRQIARPLHAVSAALQASVQQLGSAADQISASSKELAEGSQTQAASLEETSASLEETTSMAQQTTQDAKQTLEAAAATQQATQSATQAMQQMNLRMQGIRQATNDVGKILKTIDEIAFQTNILALNAAVEAARAGEAGAGFAVVADEVRNLAKRCAEAARNTADLTAQVTVQVQEGATISEAVGQHLSDILAKAQREDELVRHISRAATEQGQGLLQINQAVSSIDQITQRNAGVSEQAAGAAVELQRQAAILQEQMVAMIELLDGRRTRNAPPPADRPSVTKTREALGLPA